MRIGINASFLRKQSTGVGQVTLNFFKKLSERKTYEFFVYLEEDTDFKFPKNFKKRVFLPVWKRDDLVRKIWWEKFLLPKKIKEDDCDAFISLYQSTTILSNKVRHLMVVHDIIPRLFPEYLNNLRKKINWKLTERAIKKADKIVSVSHRTEKDLVQYLKIDPGIITVSHIAVDDIFRKEVSEERSKKTLNKYQLSSGYIYCGGGLEVRKNVEGVIRAYKILLEKNKKLHFVDVMPKLVISGKLMPRLAPLVTDAEKLIKELNLTQHVKLLDFVSQEDLPALYGNASFFVYPSHYEGFGLPVLEAMSVGTPVITSKKSSLPEVGQDAVLYTDPDDINDLVMVIKNIMVNNNLREIIKKRGKERAEYFSWDKFVDKVFNIINENIYQ